MIRLTFAAFLLSALLRPLPLFAVESDAVVGTGSAASCTEAAFTSTLDSVQATGGGTITFNCGGAATIGFSSQKIITTAVTLDGAFQITLDGGNNDRLFYVFDGGSLTLEEITLQKGYTPNSDGGAVYVDVGSSLTMNIAVIRDSNTGSSYSGGAVVSYGLVHISNSRFENNSGGSGGALYVRFEAAGTEIWNTTFRNNRTTSPTSGWGGAILLWDGADISIHSSSFETNRAYDGGAIHNAFPNSQAVIDSSTFTGNSAVNGGAIRNLGVGTTLYIRTSSFTGNTADDYGGGILNEGSLYLEQVNVIDNSARAGGGVLSYREISLLDVNISGNQSTSSGGGLVNFNGSADLRNVTISGNSAGTQGGGFYNSGTSVLRNVTFSGNTAVEGGGIYALLSLSNVNLNHVTFSGNLASAGSSVFNVYSVNNIFTFRNTIFSTLSGANCTGVQVGSSAGFNLASDGSCQLNQVGDRANTPADLSPLKDNHGFTLTHLPRLTSLAINNGTGIGAEPTDQRGLPRPSGGTVDIGAVERQPNDSDYQVFMPLLVRP